MSTGKGPRRRDLKICIFTSMHPVDDVRVGSKFANSFAGRGASVTWIGPHIVFHGEDIRDPRIRYHLVPAPISRVDRLRGLLRLVRIARRQTEVDWWYCPDPDAAWALTRFVPEARGKVIFDIHELFHEGHMDHWVGVGKFEWLRERVRKTIGRISARSAITVGVNEAVLQPYTSAPDEVVVVRNLAPAWFGKDDGHPGRKDGFRFFHGKAISNNGTDVLLKAAAQLGSSETYPGLEVVFLEAGSAAESKAVGTLQRQGPDPRVSLLPRVQHSDMPDLMNSCRVGVIGYGRSLGVDSLPNRLFEYMAAGLALLVPSYSQFIVPIVEGDGLGLSVDFEDPDAVATAMAWFYDHPEETAQMGGRARRCFLQSFTWETDFERLYNKLMEQR